MPFGTNNTAPAHTEDPCLVDAAFVRRVFLQFHGMGLFQSSGSLKCAVSPWVPFKPAQQRVPSPKMRFPGAF